MKIPTVRTWFSDEIGTHLSSIYETNSRTAQAMGGAVDTIRFGAYQEGFVSALRAVALSFGIDPSEFIYVSDAEMEHLLTDIDLS